MCVAYYLFYTCHLVYYMGVYYSNTNGLSHVRNFGDYTGITSTYRKLRGKLHGVLSSDNMWVKNYMRLACAVSVGEIIVWNHWNVDHLKCLVKFAYSPPSAVSKKATTKRLTFLFYC